MNDYLPQPIPSLGTEAYELERKLCLESSSQKLENYNRYLQSERTGQLDYLPVKLDIENVSRCNFRCIMCQVSDFPKGHRADDMSYDDFRQLIDEQYGLVEIKLQGMGEPTLAKDTLYEMISYARSKHIWIRTITNASLLHINDNYKKMIDSGANEVQISIDGACKETYESIRRGSNFERVIENCKLINNYAESRNIHPTKMWVVVQQSNMGELSQLVELANEAGFKSLVFSLEIQDWGQDKWQEINDNLSVGNRITGEMAENLVKQGGRYGMKVAFWEATTKYSTTDVKKLCPWPFERAYVSSDMRIVPCCMIGNPEVSDLGDAHKFTRDWKGNAYKEFRQAHLEGNIPRVCQGCYEGASLVRI
ncbi:radical SAM/SPASM domain-containing protein [Chloroflexota bacterium]